MERYIVLRRNYLRRAADLWDEATRSIKIVICTKDFYLKVFAGLSGMSTLFTAATKKQFVWAEEVHEYSVRDFSCIAARADSVVGVGDPLQRMASESTAGQSCVHWLQQVGQQHKLIEIWRYGQEIVDLIKMETSELYRSAAQNWICVQPDKTSVYRIPFVNPNWEFAPDGRAFQSSSVFSCIGLCILAAAFMQCKSILVLFYYAPLVASFESFWAVLKTKVAIDVELTVCTPSSSGGFTVDCTIFLLCQRRVEADTMIAGHQKQPAKRYTGITRQRKVLFLMGEDLDGDRVVHRMLGRHSDVASFDFSTKAGLLDVANSIDGWIEDGRMGLMHSYAAYKEFASTDVELPRRSTMTGKKYFDELAVVTRQESDELIWRKQSRPDYDLRHRGKQYTQKPVQHIGSPHFMAVLSGAYLLFGDGLKDRPHMGRFGRSQGRLGRSQVVQDTYIYTYIYIYIYTWA
jgi:hypothetical protein